MNQESKQIGRIFTAAVAAICLFATVAIGAPIISGTSGEFKQGSTVIIQGSGFGSKSPAAPKLWDDFEGNTIGASIDDPVHGQYSRVGPTKYTGNDAYTGARSAISEVRVGVYDPGLVSSWLPDLEQNVFVSMKWKVVSTSGSLAPHNFKLIRTNAHDPDPTHGYPNYNIGKDRNTSTFQGIVNHGLLGQVYVGGFGEASYQHAAWNSVSIWDHLGSVDTPNGFAGRTINGGVTEARNITTLQSNKSLGGLRSAFFAGYLSHEGSDVDLYLDDVYADITLARVEIFSANGTHEMQLPVSWNESQIEITFNQGRYVNGETVGLVVYDSANNASAPISIVVSGSGGGIIELPGQPGQPYPVQ